MKNGIYYRRKVILSSIRAFGQGGVSKLKFQKLLFLFCQKQKTPVFYFVPYKYGCFSFQAAKDTQVLNAHYGLLVTTEDKLSIRSQETDVETLNHQDRTILTSLQENFFHFSEEEIVNYVYDNFPFYTINSEWEMSKKQRNEAQKQRDKIYKLNEKTLFTIGYEGRSIDDYLRLLIENNIHLLCDVRKNAFSMKYGFSRNQLEQYCRNMDIDYIHMPELGVASQKRKHLNSTDDLRTLFTEYTRKLPENKKSLSRIAKLLEAHNRIALTCFEKEPHYCHRHCICEYLEGGEDITCQHL